MFLGVFCRVEQGVVDGVMVLVGDGLFECVECRLDALLPDPLLADAPTVRLLLSLILVLLFGCGDAVGEGDAEVAVLVAVDHGGFQPPQPVRGLRLQHPQLDERGELRGIAGRGEPQEGVCWPADAIGVGMPLTGLLRLGEGV